MLSLLPMPWLCIIGLAYHLVAASPAQVFLQDGPILRNATLDDAAAITHVIRDAFDPSPPFRYRYQFRDQYPAEHWRCMYEGIREGMALPFITVQVITLPANAASSDGRRSVSEDAVGRGRGGDRQIVSVGVWADPRKVHDHSWNFEQVLTSKCTHKDENRTRALDYDQKFSKAHNKYLNEVYGSNQFYLAALGTHPDFQHRGYGEQLVLHGIDMAEMLGLDKVTLIATPLGEPVYFSLGFQSIANFSVSSVDGDMDFPYDVMVYP